MTARARELTARATDVPAGQLRVMVDALGRMHYDVGQLLAQAGVRRAQLNDPDALVPCGAFAAVFGGALAQRRLPDLAAHVAFQTPVGAYPLLDYLVLTTDTVGDALRQLQRFFHVTSAPSRFDIVTAKDGVRLVVQPGDDPFIALYQTAMAIHHLRDETAEHLRVSGVSLMREPEARADLERLLGCPVRAPAIWSGIEFPCEALVVPLRRRDPVLRRVLERHAAVVPAPVGPDGDIVLRVRAALAARPGVALDTVARGFAMAPRTLQRRLAAAGVSYKGLFEAVRREVAAQLLDDRALAVAEVGYLLGFSEPSAFHRAFKRWFGVTPLAFRRRKRPGPAE